jgi:hypothetical protein
MVKVSEFYGIRIIFWLDDHPPPHFHACYAEYEIQVSIDPIQVMHGQAPGRIESMVLAWAEQHQRELCEAWKMARQMQELPAISPLK